MGPRDGLQNDDVSLDPATRAELCTRLAATGLTRIEAASFVHPKLVPQMAGAEEVFAHLPTDDGVAYSSLVLNRKGLDRALQTSTTEIHVAYPVTETFAKRNQNQTVEEAAQHGRGDHRGERPKTTATISVAFGCPFEGKVDPGLVIEHAHRMAAAGADEVILADTIGVGVPRQVKDLVPRALRARQARRPTPAQHAQHGLRERVRRPRVRRDDLRRVRGRPRRLPVRAARDGQHRHRGPALPLTTRASRPASTSTR